MPANQHSLALDGGQWQYVHRSWGEGVLSLTQEQKRGQDEEWVSGDSLAALTDCKIYFKYLKLHNICSVLSPYFKLLLVDLKIVKVKTITCTVDVIHLTLSWIFG